MHGAQFMYNCMASELLLGYFVAVTDDGEHFS